MCSGEEEISGAGAQSGHTKIDLLLLRQHGDSLQPDSTEESSSGVEVSLQEQAAVAGVQSGASAAGMAGRGQQAKVCWSDN